MAFAIMRSKKLTGMGSVAASLKHCYRERDTPNADQARTGSNEHHAARSTNEAMGKLRSMLPEKRRKDAVLAVEYVMTASPSWWETASADQQRQFFERSIKWLADKYGADRIITASIHRDETSPHLSAFVVPLTADGRLSAKEFIGSKAKMSADQSNYAKAVASLGLERGIEGSRAKHQSIQSYYGAIKSEPKAVAIRPEDLKPRAVGKSWIATTYEDPEAVAERINATIRKAYAPTVQAAAGARLERKKAQEAQETAKQLRSRLQPVLEALAPLSASLQRSAITAFKEITDRLVKQSFREKIAEAFESIAGRRERRERGYRDPDAKWQATPAPLKVEIEEFNQSSPLTRMARLNRIRDDEAEGERIGSLLQVRKKALTRLADRGIGM